MPQPQQPTQPTLLFTGGGSAGHVTPNLALINRFRVLAVHIIYIGSKTGIEKQLLTQAKVPYYAITSGKWRRYFCWQNLLAPWQVICGIIQGFLLCRRFKPQVVFSKGGFVAFPVVFAAWLNRIPVIVHESDLMPGLANRLSFFLADRIYVSFSTTVDYIRNKTKVIVTGTPIREFLIRGKASQGLAYCGFDRSKPILLVMTGSLGSEILNKAIRRLLSELLNTFQVVHICGPNKTDPSFNALPGYRQFDYLQAPLADVLACADVVISRAGATTIAELLALKKPHILLPLSQKASRGDQIANASYWAKQGLSYVIYAEEMSDTVLLTTIQACYRNRGVIQQALNRFKPIDSSQIIYQQLLVLLEGFRKRNA